MAENKTLTGRIKEILQIEIEDEQLDRKIYITAKALIGSMERGGAVFDKSDDYAMISDSELFCVSTGVNDLLFNRAGESKLSPAYMMLSQQLCTGNEVSHE